MAVGTVKQQITAIKKSAEKMDAAKTERIETASAGDVVRQGDIYLVCLEAPQGGDVAKSRQLAPGSTQGSRHVAVGECRVVNANRASVASTINRLVKGANVPEQLIGPVIECEGDTTITHPEHGHRILPAGSVWGCVYQRAHAEEVRRVQD